MIKKCKLFYKVRLQQATTEISPTRRSPIYTKSLCRRIILMRKAEFRYLDAKGLYRRKISMLSTKRALKDMIMRKVKKVSSNFQARLNHILQVTSILINSKMNIVEPIKYLQRAMEFLKSKGKMIAKRRLKCNRRNVNGMKLRLKYETIIEVRLRQMNKNIFDYHIIKHSFSNS